MYEYVKLSEPLKKGCLKNIVTISVNVPWVATEHINAFAVERITQDVHGVYILQMYICRN